jgi:ribosomal-protein-alanine N-acetyltransferase
LKAIKQPVGSIGTEKAKMESLRTEIGYCIGRKFWNRGYTTEALSRVINFFFGEVGFNRIEAMHDVLNPASGRVMQKCGMIHEGTMREVGLNKDGEFFSWQLYAILQSDWRNAVVELNG